MKRLFLLLILLNLACCKAFSISVSTEDANKIAEKVWQNECRGTLEGLTNWKKGENFASLGIGHFIWYPVGKREQFRETFPDLLKFLQSRGAVLPSWLKKAQGCPWSSREEFYLNIKSAQMTALRQMLFDTKHLQALFLAQRLENSLPEIIEHLPSGDKEKIMATFHQLSCDPRGLYALIDYLNFKGTGTVSDETYKGQGWGLLQVLQRIPPSSKNAVADFVEAARTLLMQRVQNSPPDRNEQQWLKGWLNRVNTYLS
jgi:hypothetical protein